VHRRRRDLAIIKTLGFTRGQVRTAVAAQANTTIVIALIVGIPLGTSAGRWLWTLRAHELGTVNEPSVPWTALALLILAALALANVIATLARRSAANTRPPHRVKRGKNPSQEAAAADDADRAHRSNDAAAIRCRYWTYASNDQPRLTTRRR
jgi:predicted lysophospholipase L1 biosynthesis ABC-type transport system permease subunit